MKADNLKSDLVKAAQLIAIRNVRVRVTNRKYV